MASKTNVVSIPELEIGEMQVRIRGLTPLITNRFSERAMESIEKAQQGAAKLKKPPRDPEEEFRAACYRTPDDRYGFPAVGVKLAMVTAGQRFAGERRGELYGALIIPADMLEIVSEEPRMRSDRVVLSGMSRVSSIAYRPEFWPWEMDIPLRFNSQFITADQVVNLLTLAGFSVGIGDWRVEKKGSFGQFEIKEMTAF